MGAGRSPIFGLLIKPCIEDPDSKQKQVERNKFVGGANGESKRDAKPDARRVRRRVTTPISSSCQNRR